MQSQAERRYIAALEALAGAGCPARDGCPIRDGVAAARGLDTVNLIRVEGRAAMRDGAVMAAEARATGDVSESGHTLSFETLTLAAELIARRTSLDHVRRFLHGYVRRGFLAALR